LKAGWSTKKLGDLADQITDGTHNSPEYVNSGIPMLDSKHVKDGFVIDDSEPEKFISVDTDNLLAKRCKPRPGDILVSSRGSIGKIAIVKEDQDFNIMGNMILIRLSAAIRREFAAYYLLSQVNHIESIARGAAQKGLYLNQVREYELPFPSLSEQHRIVAILDDAFDGIATAKANAEKNLQNARALFESHLQAVFSQRGEEWEQVPLGGVCDFVRGPFGGSLKKSIFVSEGYAVYEQQHAIYDQFDTVRYFVDEAKFAEMKRFELFPNDLIMSCSGTMGKVAIVPNEIKRGIINQALLKLTPGVKILNIFLKLWMESPAFQDALMKEAGGAAIQNVASVKILKEIKIPLPAIDKQKGIVESIKSFSQETQRLESIYRRKLAALDELKKSLLHQAFSGQL
jgi:type I restriction enzyme S subunit